MIRNGNEFEEGSISVITLIEVLRAIENEQKRKRSKILIEETFDILDVDEAVASSYVEMYFELKKRGKAVSEADALIAATARTKGETLLTLDRDFEKFEPLIKVRFLPQAK
ncbi:MAG: type II toxin-antitoxin system VapC family toxin [Nitrososphaerota archaeon]|nr:type II toxin-antitoxin system VapC family toxin [Nitrososphaerota archaeon]